MDKELWKLCKQVYARSDLVCEAWPLDKYTPLYTTDYLLEKLPQWVEPSKNEPHLLTLQPNPIGPGWQALYRLSVATPTSDRRHAEEIHTADTPLKALLKLALALTRRGEL
jgi:hypothetical protein